jgi:uncharacterized protein Smg (DUF494 family)
VINFIFVEYLSFQTGGEVKNGELLNNLKKAGLDRKDIINLFILIFTMSILIGFQ